MTQTLEQLNREFEELIAEQERAAAAEVKARAELEGIELNVWRGIGAGDRYNESLDRWREAKRAVDRIAAQIAENVRARQRLALRGTAA